MTIELTVYFFGDDVLLSNTIVVEEVTITVVDNIYQSGGGGAVNSVNGKTGTVVLDASDIAETSTLKWLTSTLKTAYDGAVTAITNIYTKTETNTLLSSKADLVNGTVPASQLPSYVDDVLEYANLASFPAPGETAKIYIALDTNKTYRWTGSTYGSLDEGIVLGETSSTAYRGDRGKEAYDLKHSHSNKSTLDLIEEALTTALKSAYDSAVNWITTNGTNLINHLANTNNPHNTTASQVGAYTSGSVDTLLSAKVDKVTGKGLSANDLTDILKTAYDSAVTWITTNGTNILNHLSNRSNPHSVTPAQIGAHTVIDGTITTATLTGTTAETSLGYITIPANSFAVGKVLALESFLNRPSGTATTVVRFRVSNSITPASISSEPLLATLNVTNTSLNNPFVRRNIKYFSATSTRCYPNTTSLVEDNAAITASLSDLNIDYTTIRYVHLTAQPTNSGDSISPYKLKLTY